VIGLTGALPGGGLLLLPEEVEGAGEEESVAGFGTVPLPGVTITFGTGTEELDVLVVLVVLFTGGAIGRMLFVAVEGKVKTVMLKTI
jgi:hypothetical protein